MKSALLFKKSLFGFFSAATLTAATPVIAATVFEANFDGPPYSSGAFAPVPTGDGVLSYGSWVNNTTGNAWLLTTDEEKYSGTHSLVLDRLGAFEGGNAQVLGYFGTTNVSAPIESALSFSMAFRVTDISDDNWASIAFRNAAGDNVGYAYLGGGGEVKMAVGPAQTFQTVGSVLADQWYILQVFLPDASGSEYTISLFDADGSTLLGSESVAVVGAAVGGYSYFTVGNSLADSAVYIDNISAQAIPEPSTMVLGVISLLLAGQKLRRVRKTA